jgi:hypothetical protein
MNRASSAHVAEQHEATQVARQVDAQTSSIPGCAGLAPRPLKAYAANWFSGNAWWRTCSRPQLESEALVKFFFADLGTRDDALQSLSELVSQAQALLDAFRSITATHTEPPGPFPERLHIGSLIGRFLFEHSQTIASWASWAKAHVAEWPETGPGTAVLGEKVQEENARLAGIHTEPNPGPRAPMRTGTVRGRPIDRGTGTDGRGSSREPRDRAPVPATP